MFWTTTTIPPSPKPLEEDRSLTVPVTEAEAVLIAYRWLVPFEDTTSIILSEVFDIEVIVISSSLR